MRNRLLTATVFLCVLTCTAKSQDLQMQVPPPQGALVGQQYAMPVTVTGGIMPYTWQVESGELPPGLKLQPHKGSIVGTPTAAGTYRFTIGVVDSSIPKLHLQKEFNIQVIEGLTVDWKETPAPHGNKITGSAVVTNQSTEEFVLTVVVVAVNEIGRATALGYQHFHIAGGSSSQVIPFGTGITPGIGTYYVRVDAVAHRPGKKHVFRASKQTSPDIKLAQF